MLITSTGDPVCGLRERDSPLQERGGGPSAYCAGRSGTSAVARAAGSAERAPLPSPPPPRAGSSGQGGGAGRDGPGEHFLIGPALPRRREEGRAGGPAQDRTRRHSPARSTSRRPGRGRPAPAQPRAGPLALSPPPPSSLSSFAACCSSSSPGSWPGAGSEQSQLPLQSPFFPSARLARASLALKAVNVWSHSSPFSLAALSVSRSTPDQ